MLITGKKEVNFLICQKQNNFMIITLVYILIFFILFYVALTGFKAVNIGIEAKKRNKFERNKKKSNKKNVLKELESLNNLYKSRALSKKEFQKAKNQILKN